MYGEIRKYSLLFPPTTPARTTRRPIRVAFLLFHTLGRFPLYTFTEQSRLLSICIHLFPGGFCRGKWKGGSADLRGSDRQQGVDFLTSRGCMHRVIIPAGLNKTVAVSREESVKKYSRQARNVLHWPATIPSPPQTQHTCSYSFFKLEIHPTTIWYFAWLLFSLYTKMFLFFARGCPGATSLGCMPAVLSSFLVVITVFLSPHSTVVFLLLRLAFDLLDRAIYHR